MKGNNKKRNINTKESSSTLIWGLLPLQDMSPTFISSLYPSNSVRKPNSIRGLLEWVSHAIQGIVNEYSAVILFYTLKCGYCYKSSIEKVFNLNERVVDHWLKTLASRGIIERVNLTDIKEVKTLQEFYNLSSYHIRKTSFYKLTGPAKEFYNQISKEIWQDILPDGVIKTIEKIQSELEKTRKKIGDSILEEADLTEKSIAAFILRYKHNDMDWLNARASKRGIPTDVYIEEMKKIAIKRGHNFGEEAKNV